MQNAQPLACRTEQDVRERIIYPLLERLGYSPAMITTQLTLRYKWQYLGHKKGAKKDRLLQGEADYIMDVDGRLRFVVEAKKPGIISDDDREQGDSYAMHPEVRAIVFAIISGTHFEIYHTFEHPEAGPILAFEYKDLEEYIQRLKNVVSPDSLRRSHPAFVIDTGKQLAPGLRSFAKLHSGKVTYTKCPPIGENIVGYIVHLTEGSVVRREEGGISVYIGPSFHHGGLNAFSDAIEAAQIELITQDESISTNPDCPTIFKYEREVVIREGTPVPSFTPLHADIATAEIRILVQVKVSGFLDKNIFSGELVTHSIVPPLTEPFRFCAKVVLSIH